METSSEIKSKSIGKILWEALELWKDHMFPLFFVAIVATGLLILGNIAIVYFFGTNVSPEEADAVVVRQEMILSSLYIVLLIVITAMLDGIIWSYFSSISLKTSLKDNMQVITQRFMRIVQVDVIFIGAMMAVFLSIIWLLAYSNLQNLEGLQFFGFMFFLLLVAGILLFVFTPYRFIIRPLFAMSKIDLKAATKKGYRHFFTGSFKVIGLMLLLYLIMFLLTPQTHVIWIQHLSFVILGPYAAMVVWVYYRQLPLSDD